MEKKNAILFVKVIAILGYIGAGLMALGGLLMLFGGSFIAGLMPIESIPQLFGALAGAFFVVMGIIMIGFAVLGVFVARGLWNHKRWARIVCIIFSALGVLSGLVALPGSIIQLILNGVVLYFLAFDRTVIKLFK